MNTSIGFVAPTRPVNLQHRSNFLQRESRCKAVDDASWDPEGILPPQQLASEGHFARRAREAHAATIKPLQNDYNKKELRNRLRDSHFPVDMTYEGLKVIHIDPPLFLIDTFFSAEECDALVLEASTCGKMKDSQIGSGSARSSGSLASSTAYSSRRTSTSMLLNTENTAGHTQLQKSTDLLQRRALKLLGKSGTDWAATGFLPDPGQYSFEGLQVTKYENGQHFLSHEDAFPGPLAQQNGFQRMATLLVYLNNVTEGGQTRFDMLNLSIAPSKGLALLFFPAFSDGQPDKRTIHTAVDALDTKWVTQQWVAVGVGSQKKLETVRTQNIESRLRSGTISRKKKGNSQSKGFGKA